MKGLLICAFLLASCIQLEAKPGLMMRKMMMENNGLSGLQGNMQSSNGLTPLSAYSSGMSGMGGMSGYSGMGGMSGYSGMGGMSGYSGMGGMSGYSGMGGMSGYSGMGGMSGYSGMGGLQGLTSLSAMNNNNNNIDLSNLGQGSAVGLGAQQGRAGLGSLTGLSAGRRIPLDGLSPEMMKMFGVGMNMQSMKAKMQNTMAAMKNGQFDKQRKYQAILNAPLDEPRSSSPRMRQKMTRRRAQKKLQKQEPTKSTEWIRQEPLASDY